jgi:hypothetical protein
VTICRDCGRFRVFAERDGHAITTTFDLPTWQLVSAAAQYARHLDGDEAVEDFDRTAGDIYYDWIRGKVKDVVRRFRRMNPIDAAIVATRLADHWGDMARASFLETMERISDRMRKIRKE